MEEGSTHDHRAPAGRRWLAARNNPMAQEAGAALGYAGAQPLVARMVVDTNSRGGAPHAGLRQRCSIQTLRQTQPEDHHPEPNTQENFHGC